MVTAMVTEDVVIIGGGPVGLMLAAELRLAGVRPVVLERLPGISQVPKGNGLVGQIVPVLDYRGLLEPCRAEATWAGPVPGFQFGTVDLDFSRLAVSPLHVIGIPQRRLEYVLDARLRELGGSVRREHKLLTFTSEGEGEGTNASTSPNDYVTLRIRGPEGEYSLRTRYLVGCDGAHSQVRKASGIGFPGVTSGEVSRIGRVTLPASLIVPGAGGEVNLPGFGRLRPASRIRTPHGAFSIAPLSAVDRNAASDVYIVSASEETGAAAGEPGWFDPDEPMTLAELSASAARVLGVELPMSDPVLLSRTVGNSRQADRYLRGRILLAGDAAHLFGLGGSLNVGLLDAINLGWKLAAAMNGSAPDGLLETYHAERHAAGKRTLMSTQAQRLLSGAGEEAAAMRALVTELVEYHEPLRHLGELIQGSDYRHPTGPGVNRPHALQGLLAPDISVETSIGTTRVAELMRAARPVLLDFSKNVRGQTPTAVAAVAAEWSNQVTIIEASSPTEQPPAAAILIRPDGYVAWAASFDQPNPADGLRETLEFRFGAPGR